MDVSKILVSVRGTDISGHELSGILRDRYHLELEMACSSYVCAITSVGDTEESMGRLVDALIRIDRELQNRCSSEDQAVRTDTVIPTESVCTLLEAEEQEKEKCLLAESCGRISGDFVTLYPPGIPILTPGERISREIIERVERYLEDGFEVHGISEGFLKVLKRER